MKSVIVGSEKPNKPAYPVLKEHGHIGGFIVLFTGPHTGVVVHTESKTRLGENRDDWAESNYELYSGEVTLSN